MTSHTFLGGVHPSYHKDLSSGACIEELAVKSGDRFFIPLSQHIGVPAVPIVEKGDQVFCGQVIGESSGFISANVHSSVDGQVIDIADVEHPVTGTTSGIIVEASQQSGSFKNISDEGDLTDVVKNAGITGMGGATFPSHVKLSPTKKIDTIIVNCAECEPYLTCDYRQMLEYTEEIVKGALMVKAELKAANLIFGVEDNKPEAIKKFKSFEDKYDIQVKSLGTRYPQGGEKQLIKAVTGRVVPMNRLPMEVNVIVHNISTIYAIYQAATLKRPLIDRVVTVTGAVSQPKNLRVRLGTPISRLIESCGGFSCKPSKIILGGPMMGFAVSSIDIPVNKGVSGVLVLQDSDLPSIKERNCVRCARCVDTCPMSLNPAMLEKFCMYDRYEELEDWRLTSCIECGCCSYVCPSRRPLVGGFRVSKRFLAQYLKDKDKM